MKTRSIAIIEDDIEYAGLQLQKVNSVSGFICTQLFVEAQDFLKSSLNPDIILLDLNLPNMDGLTALPLIAKKCPNASIIINSVKEDIDTVFDSIEMGAVGYIDKLSFFETVESVLTNIRDNGAYITPKVARKIIEHFQQPNTYKEQLTPREIEVACFIKDGLSYKKVAERCDISLDTVRMHIRNIYKKLNVNTKHQLTKIISRVR